jgi:two-component system cell cycle sensor histidine kinase PleC
MGAMAAMLLREISGRMNHEIAIQENNAKLNLTNRSLKLEHSALRITSTELAAERVKLQETNAQLLVAQQRSEAASQAKNVFLANMSHELRTPLNAIIGFSEIVRDRMFGSKSPAYFDYAADINNAGVHLLEIINNVLDIAKIESGKMELWESVCDLTGLLEASLRSIKMQANARGIKILRHYPEEAIHVRCDETRLKQAAINILSNAVKFTPEGGLIEIRQELEASGEVRIAVKDTGIGMTAREIEAAFEQFRQIENSLTKRFEGTGLGLPLAKQLTALHGGTIGVSSKPSAGTEVSLRLPAWRVVDACSIEASGKAA